MAVPDGIGEFFVRKIFGAPAGVEIPPAQIDGAGSRSGRRPGGPPETRRGRAVPEPLLAVVQTLLKTEDLPLELTDLSLGLGSLVQIALDLAPQLLGGSLGFEQLVR